MRLGGIIIARELLAVAVHAQPPRFGPDAEAGAGASRGIGMNFSALPSS